MNEPSDEEGVVIVCHRYPLTEGTPRVTGSTLGKCSECGHEVSIAPSSVTISTERYSKSQFICILCFFEHVKKGAVPEIKTFPEQWDEIRETMERRNP